MVRVALLLVLVSLMTGCADPSRVAEQEPRKGLTHEYENDVVRWVEPDLVVEAQYLPQERADLYFSYFKDGKYKNPFTPAFLIISLSIENKGTARLSFEPRMATLLSSKGAAMSSRDFTSVYAELALADGGDQTENMAAFRATCFDSQVYVAPGEKVQRLIVFTKDKDMGEDAALTLDGLYMDHKPRTVRLIFKKLL